MFKIMLVKMYMVIKKMPTKLNQAHQSVPLIKKFLHNLIIQAIPRSSTVSLGANRIPHLQSKSKIDLTYCIVGNTYLQMLKRVWIFV